MDWLWSESHPVISLVGGGGKTTLLYALAEEFRRRGRRTLVTTTTHILRPSDIPVVRDSKELVREWECGRIAVAGADAPGGKLTAPAGLDEMLRMADAVVIEADGAKGMPCKVPRNGEPVIVPQCTQVIAVAGMCALGRPLAEVCFRISEAVELLSVPETHPLTEEDLAVILSSDTGARKGVGRRSYTVVLNQCDDRLALRRAMRVKTMLHERGVERVVLTRRGQPVKETEWENA